VAHKTIDGITSSVIPYVIAGDVCTVLLGQRGAKAEAFPSAWCLVGGFLEPHAESLKECAARELKEETGLEVAPGEMKLVTVQSDPKRDPRGHIVDTVWSCRLAEKTDAEAADDLQAVAWHSLADALKMELAFDHGDSLRRFAEAEWLG
jgi:8-oxo-dGTP diphosphatase